MHMMDIVVANASSACHVCRLNNNPCLGIYIASGKLQVTVGEKVIEDQTAVLQAAQQHRGHGETRTTRGERI